jgi:lipopolysaccharide export system protein LptC
MKGLVVALLLFLIAGAGVVYVTSRGERDERTQATAGASPLDADYDYYVQDMRTTRFDSTGQPMSELRAQRVTHYPDGDRAELQAPAFRSLGSDSDAWQVSAEAGTLSPDAERTEDRLELQGEVQLYKRLPRENFIDLRTSALTVFTATEEVVNTAPVTLQTRDSRLEGVGMRALLAQDYIKLNDSNGSHDTTPLP